MKSLRLSVSLVMLAALLMVAGCAMAPVIPPRGILYNDQKAPLFSGREIGTKEGKASAYSVLFLVGWGDCSIEAAASDGNISQIKHTDYRLFNVLGVFQQFTTIVKGE